MEKYKPAFSVEIYVQVRTVTENKMMAYVTLNIAVV